MGHVSFVPCWNLTEIPFFVVRCSTHKLWIPVAHISILKMKEKNKWAVTLFKTWTHCKRKWLMPPGFKEALYLSDKSKSYCLKQTLSQAGSCFYIHCVWSRETVQNISGLLSGLVNFLLIPSLKSTYLKKMCPGSFKNMPLWCHDWLTDIWAIVQLSISKKIVSNRCCEYTRLPDSSMGLSLVPVLLFYIH